MIGRLALIVGHTSTRRGASSLAPLSVSEFEYNSELSDRVLPLLPALEIEGQIFRHDVSYADTYKRVNAWCVNGVAIELHFNSEVTGTARGTETLCDLYPDWNLEWARVVQASTCLAFDRKGRQNRGIKILTSEDRGHYNMDALKCPSVIVEPFFGSNWMDAELGLNKKQEYVMAIAMAAKLFLRNKLYAKHSRS